MRRRFVTLDVFTTRRFAGNPLAIVLDPEVGDRVGDGRGGGGGHAQTRPFL